MKFFWFMLWPLLSSNPSSVPGSIAKGLVIESAPLHAQSAWGCKEERLRDIKLATCCSYLSKKKKKKSKALLIASFTDDKN